MVRSSTYEPVKLGLIVVMLMVPAAAAHEWYPSECCHNPDCAPRARRIPTRRFPAGHLQGWHHRCPSVVPATGECGTDKRSTDMRVRWAIGRCPSPLPPYPVMVFGVGDPFPRPAPRHPGVLWSCDAGAARGDGIVLGFERRVCWRVCLSTRALRRLCDQARTSSPAIASAPAERSSRATLGAGCCRAQDSVSGVATL
jgi:hypothetical protein